MVCFDDPVVVALKYPHLQPVNSYCVVVHVMHAPMRFVGEDDVTKMCVPPHHGIEEHIVRMQSASQSLVCVTFFGKSRGTCIT
jgi:hypothetical protein